LSEIAVCTWRLSQLDVSLLFKKKKMRQ